MTDFRHIYRADFTLVYAEPMGESLYFALRAEKPSRYAPPQPIVRP